MKALSSVEPEKVIESARLHLALVRADAITLGSNYSIVTATTTTIVCCS